MEAWEAGTLRDSESSPLPTSFYRKRKLLPTPTRPPKANPSFSLQEQGLGPWCTESGSDLLKVKRGERQRDDFISSPPGPGRPQEQSSVSLETHVTAAGLGPHTASLPPKTRDSQCPGE